MQISNRTGYCAIRKTDTNDAGWLDLNTLCSTPYGVDTKVKDTDTLIPQWTKDHPLIAIVEVNITVKEGEM